MRGNCARPMSMRSCRYSRRCLSELHAMSGNPESAQSPNGATRESRLVQGVGSVRAVFS